MYEYDAPAGLELFYNLCRQLNLGDQWIKIELVPDGSLLMQQSLSYQSALSEKFAESIALMYTDEVRKASHQYLHETAEAADRGAQLVRYFLVPDDFFPDGNLVVPSKPHSRKTQSIYQWWLIQYFWRINSFNENIFIVPDSLFTSSPLAKSILPGFDLNLWTKKEGSFKALNVSPSQVLNLATEYVLAGEDSTFKRFLYSSANEDDTAMVKLAEAISLEFAQQLLPKLPHLDLREISLRDIIGPENGVPELDGPGLEQAVSSAPSGLMIPCSDFVLPPKLPAPTTPGLSAPGLSAPGLPQGAVRQTRR